MASSTLNDRRCLAVIFDLDDTLVPTSQLDRAAIATAARETAGLATTAQQLWTGPLQPYSAEAKGAYFKLLGL